MMFAIFSGRAWISVWDQRSRNEVEYSSACKRIQIRIADSNLQNKNKQSESFKVQEAFHG